MSTHHSRGFRRQRRPADAAPTGDIVVLAVPYTSAAAVVSEYGDALHGKVIIDITNPITPDFQGFVTPRAPTTLDRAWRSRSSDALA